MLTKIRYYERKLARNEIASVISAFCVMFGFFCAVGFTGSLELNLMTIGQCLIREVITISCMAAAVFGINVFDARANRIKQHLQKLYNELPMH